MCKMFRVSEMTYRFVEKYRVNEQWHNFFEYASRKSVAWPEVMGLEG